MAGKVISIEIGNVLTKVCEMDYRSANAKVYNSFTFETPKGTIEDGYVKEADEFIDVLHAKLASNQIKTKKVVFTVSSSKIATREVFLPLVSRDKIMSMVRANASDYFPMDISNYYLTYTVLEKAVSSEEKKLKLLLIAAPLDMIEAYFDLARTMGLTIVTIDYAGNSIFQVLKEMKTQGTSISIHVGETNTYVTILENGVLNLQRVVSYGANSAVETLLSIDKYRYDETMDEQKAYELFMSQQLINTVIPEDDNSREQEILTEDEKIRNEVTESLRFLLGNIVRVIDYYMSKTPGARIDMIFLSGIGAEFRGMRELFSFEIGSAVKSVTSLPGANYNPTGGADSSAVMLPAVGATKGSMNLMPEVFKTKKVKNDSMLVPVVVCLAGIVGAVAMWFYGSFTYDQKANEVAELEVEKQQLKDIDDLIIAYNDTQTTFDKFMTMYKTTRNPNQLLVDFLDEMEVKMPTSFEAFKMHVTEEGVSFEIHCATKADLAEIVQQFRSFKTIQIIGLSTVEEHEKATTEPETMGYVIDENGETIPFYTMAETTEAVIETDENGSTIEPTTAEHILELTITCVYKDAGIIFGDTVAETTAAPSAAAAQ